MKKLAFFDWFCKIMCSSLFTCVVAWLLLTHMVAVLFWFLLWRLSCCGNVCSESADQTRSSRWTGTACTGTRGSVGVCTWYVASHRPSAPCACYKLCRANPGPGRICASWHWCLERTEQSNVIVKFSDFFFGEFEVVRPTVVHHSRELRLQDGRTLSARQLTAGQVFELDVSHQVRLPRHPLLANQAKPTAAPAQVLQHAISLRQGTLWKHRAKRKEK